MENRTARGFPQRPHASSSIHFTHEIPDSPQLRRAAYSVASNVVEGFAKPKGRARLNFLNISQSSLAEVGYCIHVAQRLGYISEIDANGLETEIKQVGAPLAGLIRSERFQLGAKVVGAMLAVMYFTTRLA